MKSHPPYPEPPRWATRFLHWYCREELLEEIEGDLLELYQGRLEEDGLRYARRHYCWDIIRFMRRYTIRKPNPRPNLNTVPMWKNYFKVSWRHLLRQRGFAILNLTGLSIGIAAFLLILMYVSFEHSYDSFHKSADRLYIITDLEYKSGPAEIDSSLLAGQPENSRSNYWLPLPLGPAVAEEVPQAKHVSRFTTGNAVAFLGDDPMDQAVAFGDEDFFRMFSFDFLEGTPEASLNDRYDVVITREMADRYLGKGAVLGKTIRLSINGEEQDFTVSGVIDALPPNSMFDFEMMVRTEFRPFYEMHLERWNNYNTMTLLEINEGSTEEALLESLEQLKQKYLEDYTARVQERSGLPEDVLAYRLMATPVPEAHLNRFAHMSNTSDPLYSYVLAGIALIILLVASINYISLTMSRSAGRNMEVGMRKSLGATSKHVLTQFLGEAVLIAFLALIIAVGMVLLVMPAFRELTGRELPLDLLLDPRIILVTLAAVFLTGLMAGLYPSLYFSRFKTPLVLKGRSSANIRSGFMRTLVIFQFSLCVFLLVCCFSIYRQMSFILEKDLGFNTDQVVMIKGYPDDFMQGIEDKVELIRTRLSGDPDVEGITGTSLGFARGWSQVGFDVGEKELRALNYRVDPYYLDLLDIKLIEGRNFSTTPGADKGAIIVNEALVKEMKWEEPIGQVIPFVEAGSEVIGVVKDYHARSLENEVQPLILHQTPEADGIHAFYVKLQAGRIPEGLDKVKAAWKDVEPDKPFTYFFLDEDVRSQYKEYLNWRSLLTVSTLFAIAIACLGLFGLSGVNAYNRTKEIGIRKVLGAKVSNLLWLLNRETLFLILLALAIGIPPALWAMSGWMENFSYTVSLDWVFFAMCAAVVTVLAFMSVSYHAFRAATSNPVNSLRYE